MKSNLLVSDAMTRSIVSVSPNAPIDVAIDLMVTKNFNALPVTDSQGQLVGILSDFDILRLYRGSQATRTWDEPCSQFMTTDVKTIQYTALLGEAANLFEESGLRRVMILNGDRLVGILSRRDIVRCIRDQRIGAGSQHRTLLVSQA
jgi:CBS domain-containing protein